MPNIDEGFNFPFNEKDVRSEDPKKIGDYLFDQHRSIKKMYEELAVGINDTYEMTIISNSKTGVTSPPGQPLTQLPKIGMFYIMVSGLADNMPQRCSIMQKHTVGTAAVETNLSNYQPAAGDWSGVSLVFGVLTDQIGMGHDGGAALEGLFNVTIFGPYSPQGGG